MVASRVRSGGWAPAHRALSARRTHRARRRGTRVAPQARVCLMALPLLLDAIEGLPAFTRLAGALPAPRTREAITGLAGSATAVLVAALARRFPGRFFAV